MNILKRFFIFIWFRQLHQIMVTILPLVMVVGLQLKKQKDRRIMVHIMKNIQMV
jgi:hypothetical protein